MKPFDIELAKQGKSVCLRNGRKARIICFDAKNSDSPIIALVEEGKYEVTMYFNERGKAFAHCREHDLMMLPERKTGWINIYPSICKEKVAITGPHVYKTQKEAREGAKSTCTATIPIEWEE